MPAMDFELSHEQRAYLDRVAAFANDRVASRAAAIDESARFPLELVREACALGLAGVTAPPARLGVGRVNVKY